MTGFYMQRNTELNYVKYTTAVSIWLVEYAILSGRKLELFQYVPQQKFTCSKLTIENLKKGVKYVQS